MTKKPRPIRIDGDVAFVTLTHGHQAVIDADDAAFVADRCWHAQASRNTVYAMCNALRAEGGIRGQKRVMMHRFLMNPDAEMQIDHINGDGLDNRRSNLRIATHAQNMQNRKLFTNSSTGFKGVSAYNPTGLWQAKIAINGRRIWLGVFATPEAAHDAYVRASASMHGEFSKTS